MGCRVFVRCLVGLQQGFVRRLDGLQPRCVTSGWAATLCEASGWAAGLCEASGWAAGSL